jgi:hypothetical protein
MMLIGTKSEQLYSQIKAPENAGFFARVFGAPH